MGRGRSRSGSSSFGGSRGSSRSSVSRHSRSGIGHSHHHTTVFVGGHGGVHVGTGGPGTFIFMAIIFIFFGLMALGFGIGMFAEAGRYASVKATCVKNEEVHGWYYTTYEYKVDGTEYENRSNEGWEFPEDVGAVVTIYYLKSDPNEITEERPGNIGAGIGLTVFSLIFIGAGGLLISQAVKRKGNIGTQSNNETTTNNEKIETYNKCPYCGSKYNKSSDSCPKCGASKMF